MDNAEFARPNAISIIILADQETKLLYQAVESVSWASECVVVWTGLADSPSFSSSVKIVKIPGVISDFAHLRNEAVKFAKNDWIFFLDSDEVVRPGAEEECQKFISQEVYVGGTILRRDSFLGKEIKHGEVGNVRLLRIYNKNFGQYSRPVHEILRLEGKTIPLSVVIDHYPHQSISTFLQKVIYYTQIETNLRQDEGTWVTVLQLFSFPWAKFLMNYFLKGGFLDGWRGLIYAIIMSIHSFSVRALILERKYAQRYS